MRTRVLLVAALAAALLATLVAAPAATAGASWAPAADAEIHPGVQVVSASGQCTANFVFVDASDVYLGMAAHSATLGTSSDVNGCTTSSRPIGSPVSIRATGGATYGGTLAYSSWLAMQAARETDPLACTYNDFALVKLRRRDHGKVNPSVPFFGGPTGAVTHLGTEDVYSYGNSGLRLGLTPLRPKFGVHLLTIGNGWSHRIYTATPGIPGDSGSGVFDSRGRAVGVLSTLAIAPYAGSNNATDVNRALAYTRSHGGPQVQLALGTEPFTRVGR